MLWMVTEGLASTRRTMMPAVSSSIRAFQRSEAPSPADVWLRLASVAAAVPIRATMLMMFAVRRLIGPVRSASRTAPKKSTAWRSATTVPKPDADSR